MRVNKKQHIAIAVATILVLVIAVVMIIVTPVKKEELYGEYFEIAGIFRVFPPYHCCVFRTIDDKFFYESRSVYKDFKKSEIVQRNLEVKYIYFFENSILSMSMTSFPREIKRWYSSEVEYDYRIEYRAIKIGTKIILLGGDECRILVKIDRKAKINTDSENN